MVDDAKGKKRGQVLKYHILSAAADNRLLEVQYEKIFPITDFDLI
jgi:hypothetical protein